MFCSCLISSMDKPEKSAISSKEVCWISACVWQFPLRHSEIQFSYLQRIRIHILLSVTSFLQFFIIFKNTHTDDLISIRVEIPSESLSGYTRLQHAPQLGSRACLLRSDALWQHTVHIRLMYCNVALALHFAINRLLLFNC